MKTISVYLLIYFTQIFLTEASIKTTYTDITYGKHKRNKMDIWKAESSKPSPILIYFHGGAFKLGDKSHIHYYFNINTLLKKNVTCITINYPFLQHTNNSYISIFEHCNKAIDFIKKNASKWNIDPKRIALVGTSAGALISEYLGFQRKDIQLLGAFEQPMGTEQLVISKIKKNSPPLMIIQESPQSDMVHHPRYAKMMKSYYTKNNLECIIYGTEKNGISKLPKNMTKKEMMQSFLFKKWDLN